MAQITALRGLLYLLPFSGRIVRVWDSCPDSHVFFEDERLSSSIQIYLRSSMMNSHKFYSDLLVFSENDLLLLNFVHSNSVCYPLDGFLTNCVPSTIQQARCHCVIVKDLQTW